MMEFGRMEKRMVKENHTISINQYNMMENGAVGKKKEWELCILIINRFIIKVIGMRNGHMVKERFITIWSTKSGFKESFYMD